jgi:hypothetical protein
LAVVPLLHPASHTHTAARPIAASLKMFTNLIPTFSPKNFRYFREKIKLA